jgi:hypothetical protein
VIQRPPDSLFPPVELELDPLGQIYARGAELGVSITPEEEERLMRPIIEAQLESQRLCQEINPDDLSLHLVRRYYENFACARQVCR